VSWSILWARRYSSTVWNDMLTCKVSFSFRYLTCRLNGFGVQVWFMSFNCAVGFYSTQEKNKSLYAMFRIRSTKIAILEVRSLINPAISMAG
jgi:hypothetical protein